MADRPITSADLFIFPESQVMIARPIKPEELEPIHRAWLRERLGVDLDELREAADGWDEDTAQVAARALIDLLGEEVNHADS